MNIRPATSSLLSLLLLICLITTVQAQPQNRGLELLQQQYQREYDSFTQQMIELAEFCQKNSFFTAAEEIRRQASPSTELNVEYDNLPTHVLPPIPRDLPPKQLQWQTKLQSQKKEYARELYLLARRAINQRHASFAYQLVRELVYHDPDHEYGRKLLGFVRYDDEWTTPFSRTMRSRGFVDHPEFGWIPKINVARYEQGERLFDGAWMSVERERTRRKEFRNGWEIETEHFLVKTNHSLEKGVEISRQLETYHRYFMREFTAFFNTPEQIAKLFGAGAAVRGTQKDRHRVYYFANREEFIAALKAKQQKVLIATGFYLPQERTSFFYYDDDPEQAEANQETMFHEVTHQLLGESSRRNIDVGEHNNFWVIEGIACYMESFEIVDNNSDQPTFEIGDTRHPRIYWAKQKAIDDDFYVPMQRFMLMGKKDFQSAPNNDILHAYYSQATGLAHFFMHYENGLYKDEFIEYLSQVYSPINRVRYNPETLEKLTGVSFSILDQQYQDYLRTLQTQ